MKGLESFIPNFLIKKYSQRYFERLGFKYIGKTLSGDRDMYVRYKMNGKNIIRIYFFDKKIVQHVNFIGGSREGIEIRYK